MDKKHELDQVLQERFHEMSKQPPAFVWENVEDALRKRKRRAIFWWTGMSVLGVGLVGALAWTLGNAPAQPVSSFIETPAAQPSNIAASQQMPASAATQFALPAHTIADKTSIATSEQGSNRIHIATSTSAVSSSIIPAISAPVEAGAQQSKTGERIAPVQYGITSGSIIPVPQAPNAGIEASSLISAPAESIATSGSISFLSHRFAVQLFPRQQPIFVKGKAWPVKTHVRKRKEQPRNCYDFKEKPNVWLLDLYTGPSFVSKRLVNKNGAEWDSYQQQRLNTERLSFAFNGGVRATYLFRGNFKIRTGINYDHVTEVMTYTDPTSIEYLIKQVLNVQTGVWTTDTIAANFGSERTKVYNRFGMLDVPLELGYETRSGRMGIAVHGGVSLNVLFWKQGSILDPATGTPRYFTPGKANAQDVFVTRTGLSASGSVQWFWHLRPRTRLFVEPSYRIILRPISLESHPIRQQQAVAGLRFGVSRIF